MDSLVILKKPFDNVEVLQLAHTLTQKWTLSHQLRCHLKSMDETVEARTRELQAANSRLRREMDERAQAERELRHSEERFAKAFKSSPIPMAMMVLATGRFLDVNGRLSRHDGVLRIMEVTGRNPEELQLCPDAEAQTELWLRLQCEGSMRGRRDEIADLQPAKLRDCLVSAEAFST